MLFEITHFTVNRTPHHTKTQNEISNDHSFGRHEVSAQFSVGKRMRGYSIFSSTRVHDINTFLKTQLCRRTLLIYNIR